MPFPACVPALTDAVVRLRAHRAGDVDRITEQSNDPESVRWTTVPQPYAAEPAREFLALIETAWGEARGHRYWAICAADDPAETYLGTIDLRPRGAGMATVGFGLHPAGRGRHLMAAALRLVCRWWFDQGGVRVHWTANRGNFASWLVAWACGFTWHGTTPGQLPQRGELLDAWTASLAAGEPMRPAAPWSEPPVLGRGAGDGARGAGAGAGGNKDAGRREGSGDSAAVADAIRVPGATIVLRPWRDDDTAVAQRHTHPPHYLPARAVPTPETFTEWLLRARERMAQGRSLNWCIGDAHTDDPLGEVLIFVHEEHLGAVDTAELGYWLRPDARGRGLAEAAARLAVDHALGPVADGGLGLRRLVAVTAADNTASNTVLERCGFTRWGHEATATAPDGSVGPADHWERVR